MLRPPASLPGWAVGLVFLWLSFTPSLLPRAWPFQGVASGLSLVIGYGIGCALGASVQRLRSSEATSRLDRRWLIAFWAVGLVGTFLLLGQSHVWQGELRSLVGIDEESPFSGVGVVLVAAFVAGLFLLLGRLVGSLGALIIRQVERVAPRWVSIALGTAVTVFVVVGFFQGFLWSGIVSSLNEAASITNTLTNEGTETPTVPERSGGPGSLVSWESLGRQGRDFVGLGPSMADLEAFHGDGCCMQPIRVYSGLDSAETPAERAALAVRELERTGAFERDLLAVFTATGTGWINPTVSSSLEYIHGGNTAEVTMQYSYLPSWLSFLVDQEKAAAAGEELIGAVLARVEEIPESQRPELLVYGESLGSYGAEEALGDLDSLRARVDGALLVGPTFANPIWFELTANRDSGTPQWLPALAAQPSVRFARTPADLEGFSGSGDSPRVVYLQHPSDPTTWWNLELAYRKPPWAGEPAAPDRSPAFRWIPIVTFWQTGIDLANSLGVPAGYGHYFGTNVVDGWVAVSPPDGWRAEDTQRLRDLLGSGSP